MKCRVILKSIVDVAISCLVIQQLTLQQSLPNQAEVWTHTQCAAGLASAQAARSSRADFISSPRGGAQRSSCALGGGGEAAACAQCTEQLSVRGKGLNASLQRLQSLIAVGFGELLGGYFVYFFWTSMDP